MNYLNHPIDLCSTATPSFVLNAAVCVQIQPFNSLSPIFTSLFILVIHLYYSPMLAFISPALSSIFSY